MAIHEECGVFGIWDKNGGCAEDAYYALYALQHRGQESCGIATINDRELSSYRAQGLVGDAFTTEKLQELNGTMAVGHVRYSTAGSNKPENAQPLSLSYVKGTLALGYNGALTNAKKLKTEYEYAGAIFHTNVDAEIIAYAIARERLQCSSVEEAVNRAVKHLRGAFSVIVMSPQKLIAFRDPWGLRPLCMGRRGEAIIFASESCALDAVGAKYERELDPGEIVMVFNGEVTSIRDNCPQDKGHMCVFEHIYFARPDSSISGQSVHEARVNAGRFLARRSPVEADVVIGVPDSGLSAADGYSLESGIPKVSGFIKNRYIGRTFIAPTQAQREKGVRIKLNPQKSVLEGKRVIMIDDSIVRGTTSKQIVKLLREAGATEVHVRISAPEFIAPCYFGTDIPNKDSLVSCKYNVDELCELIGADSLAFLALEDVKKIAPDSTCDFCYGCFTEKYPLEVE